MKFLPTILISLLTLALGALALVQQRRGDLNFLFGAPPLERGETVYRFDSDAVGRIQILSDGKRAEVVKTDTAWMLREPWQDYADARTVRSLIDFAARLQIEDVIDRDEVEDPASYGLEKDRIEVNLFDQAGTSLCHFHIGRYTTWRGFDPELKSQDPTQPPPSFPTLIIQPAEDHLDDYLYVCCDFANPALRTFKVRDLFSEQLSLFRDHRLFYNSPSFAARITLKENNSEISLRRESLDKESAWEIVRPYELAASTEAMGNLLKGLSALQAGAVVDEKSLSLPPPLPENLDFSINIQYFNTDGSLSEPVTALFYPPESDDAQIAPVVIMEGDNEKRPAILLVPSGQGSLLASLPRSVNSLRSRTMTAMQVRDIDAVTLSDFTGRSVELTLEMVPHERASRWFVRVLREDSPGEVTVNYDGPANSHQVFDFFQGLFQSEVVDFTNDSTTSPEDYGLDRPIKSIVVHPRNGEPVRFVIGSKSVPKFYARRIPGGRVIKIPEAAYLAGRSGESHPELDFVALPKTKSDRPPSGLDLFGLDQPETVEINGTTVHLGRTEARLFFANQLDREGRNTPHVVQIDPKDLGEMPLATYPWRNERLWNINRFEIDGIKIKKRGQPPLELGHNFYATSRWSATRGGKDVTALLNTNKAEKLLKKLTEIEVKQWIGPVAENAAVRLNDPSLTISVLVEETTEEGRSLGKVRHELKLSEVVPGPANRFYFGKSDSVPSYFLVDPALHQRLSVDLLEE